MRWTRLFRVAGLCVAAATLLPAAALAQLPPPPPEASEIAACLCTQQAVQTLGSDMTARQQAYDASRDDIGRMDAQLQSARTSLNVNDPQAVAQFRQLLDRRDDTFRRSSGPLFSEWSAAVERYNARVNEYNARCANRPRNPVLLNQVQATLVCPPL